MATKPQINAFARKVGISLINSGRKFCRIGYDFKPTIVGATSTSSFIKSVISPSLSISTSDLRYHLISWEFWQWLKDLDLLDQLKYYYDAGDCDNYAFAFASEASSCFRLNTAGVAYGAIFKADTGEPIGRHCFNIIVTQETDGLHAFCYEPMSDHWAEIKKGQPIVLGNGWEYRPDWVLLF